MQFCDYNCHVSPANIAYELCLFPDSKAHGVNMGPIWGRQDPGEPHFGPMNFAIWAWFKIVNLHTVNWRFSLCGHLFYSHIKELSIQRIPQPKDISGVTGSQIPMSVKLSRLTNHYLPRHRKCTSMMLELILQCKWAPIASVFDTDMINPRYNHEKHGNHWSLKWIMTSKFLSNLCPRGCTCLT